MEYEMKPTRPASNGGKIMKQKYTITVADMELNIISDAAPDEVENIVGILDRRMRDINLKSPRCTKNEAAILCALAYCSERISMQEAFKKVEKDAFRFASENEKLKKTIEELQEELDTARKDAGVLRSILDRASVSVTPDPADVPAKAAAPKAAKPAEPVMEQISAFDPPYVEEEVAPAEAEAPQPKKSSGKSRVGSMFDLLTFSDV
jgi:cell division protein ZapA (FtsZ GTPase activity inhibitor)